MEVYTLLRGNFQKKLLLGVYPLSLVHNYCYCKFFFPIQIPHTQYKIIYILQRMEWVLLLHGRANARLHTLNQLATILS